MKRKNFFQLLILGVLLIVVGIIGIALERQENSTLHYYNHANNHLPKIAGTIGAPNGTYDVLITRVHNDSTVQIPLCSSYGGQLHGTWEYNNHTVVFEEDKWYHVTLKNNVIVQVEEILKK